MKVSFVIPVYRVESFLDQCVSSIVSQDFSDFELLLIDDGSPDNCPLLCDQWAKRDARIKVYHKQNEGLSVARNFGLKHAVGEYVVFVDSDDFWDNHASLTKIMDIFTHSPDVDLAFFNVYYFDNQKGEIMKWPRFRKVYPSVCSSTEALEMMLSNGVVLMSAWCKIIKRSLLIDNGISFKKGIYGEDIPWFIALMEKTRLVTFINDYVYAYRQNVTNSITRSNQQKHIRDMKLIIESECEIMKDRKKDQEWKDRMYSFLAYNYCILLSQFDYVSGIERKELWAFLHNYVFLLSYTAHPKVNKVNKMYKLFGLKPTSWLLHLYLNHR